MEEDPLARLDIRRSFQQDKPFVEFRGLRTRPGFSGKKHLLDKL
jgi:hypothetical protein